MDAKSFTGFFLLQPVLSHNYYDTKTWPGCQVHLQFKTNLAAPKVTSFETHFFRITDNSAPETSVSEKAEITGADRGF